MSQQEDFNNFCTIYQNMPQRIINIISDNCNFQSSKSPMYKKYFFVNYPVATSHDFYNWLSHYQSNDWQVDIWIMDDEQFEYHWPYHASFIMENNFEEE